MVSGDGRGELIESRFAILPSIIRKMGEVQETRFLGLDLLLQVGRVHLSIRGV